jgi:hypothetical protein
MARTAVTACAFEQILNNKGTVFNVCSIVLPENSCAAFIGLDDVISLEIPLVPQFNEMVISP